LKLKVYVQVCRVQVCRVRVCHVRACRVQVCRVQYVQVCHVQVCHVQMCHLQACRVQMCHVQVCRVQVCRVQVCRVGVSQSALNVGIVVAWWQIDDWPSQHKAQQIDSVPCDSTARRGIYTFWSAISPQSDDSMDSQMRRGETAVDKGCSEVVCVSICNLLCWLDYCNCCCNFSVLTYLWRRSSRPSHHEFARILLHFACKCYSDVPLANA